MALPPAWSSWQLAEFLDAVSSFGTEESAALGAVERAAEALDAEVALSSPAGGGTSIMAEIPVGGR